MTMPGGKDMRGAYFRGCGARPRPSLEPLAEVDLTCVAMNFTVFGGTSPTTVTWWWPHTVVTAHAEATRAGPWADWSSRLRGSTKTDTEATPSVNTRCATGSREPGSCWLELVAMRKPGG